MLSLSLFLAPVGLIPRAVLSLLGVSSAVHPTLCVVLNVLLIMARGFGETRSVSSGDDGHQNSSNVLLGKLCEPSRSARAVRPRSNFHEHAGDTALEELARIKPRAT